MELSDQFESHFCRIQKRMSWLLIYHFFVNFHLIAIRKLSTHQESNPEPARIPIQPSRRNVSHTSRTREPDLICSGIYQPMPIWNVEFARSAKLGIGDTITSSRFCAVSSHRAPNIDQLEEARIDHWEFCALASLNVKKFQSQRSSTPKQTLRDSSSSRTFSRSRTLRVWRWLWVCIEL